MKIQKSVIFAKKNLKISILKIKQYHKVIDHYRYTGKYRGAAHTKCNSKFSVPKDFSIVVHNGCNYDYHFIIKELAKESGEQFTCLGENTEKYITFSVSKLQELIKWKRNHKNYIMQITIY